MSALFRRTYDPSKPLFSMHVPKCGGQSFQPILNLWFRGTAYRHYYDEINGTLPVVHRLSPGSVVHGHFSRWKRTEVERFYADASQFISFIRSPFDIAVSQYFYVKEHSSDWLTKPEFSPSLESYLERSLSSRDDLLFGFLPQRTSGQSATEFIQSHFVFIGLSDEYQNSVDWLAELLTRPRVQVPHINKATYSEVIPDLRNQFRAVYQEEYELYDLVREAHEERRELAPAASGGTARIDLEKQGLREQLAESEADREARLDIIRTLEREMKATKADAAARLEIIRNLELELDESTRDRAARLDVIRNLQRALDESTRDREARLAIIQRQQADLDASAADRAAQQEVIQALQTKLASTERGLADVRAQLDAERARRRWTWPLRRTGNPPRSQKRPD
jgi:hypothetical protein